MRRCITAKCEASLAPEYNSLPLNLVPSDTLRITLSPFKRKEFRKGIFRIISLKPLRPFKSTATRRDRREAFLQSAKNIIGGVVPLICTDIVPGLGPRNRHYPHAYSIWGVSGTIADSRWVATLPGGHCPLVTAFLGQLFNGAPDGIYLPN